MLLLLLLLLLLLQLKPLGLNCLLNTNAQSDSYSTFVEHMLRNLVFQRQAQGGGATLLGPLPSAGGVLPELPEIGVGRGAGGAGVGGEWIRSDAYSDMVSCDSCDASCLLAPVIGFSSNVATSFKRLMELQVPPLLQRRCGGVAAAVSPFCEGASMSA